jgi:hypothetical protein
MELKLSILTSADVSHLYNLLDYFDSGLLCTNLVISSNPNIFNAEFVPIYNKALTSRITEDNPLFLSPHIVRGDLFARSSIDFSVAGLDLENNEADYHFPRQLKSLIVDLGLYLLVNRVVSSSRVDFNGVRTSYLFLDELPKKYNSTDVEIPESPIKEEVASSTKIINFSSIPKFLCRNSYK